MQDFQDDIKTRITFHELDNDGTQIECNVHSKKSQLFYNTNGDLFDNDILPAIYLVDNRTNCHDLVADGGNITVKFTYVETVLVYISELLLVLFTFQNNHQLQRCKLFFNAVQCLRAPRSTGMPHIL